MSERERASGIDSDDILVVRRGPGANCSSIGSALDVLFLSAVAAGAVLAGVAAAFGEELKPRAAPRSAGGGGEKSAAEAEAATTSAATGASDTRKEDGDASST